LIKNQTIFLYRRICVQLCQQICLSRWTRPHSILWRSGTYSVYDSQIIANDMYFV